MCFIEKSMEKYSLRRTYDTWNNVITLL